MSAGEGSDGKDAEGKEGGKAATPAGGSRRRQISVAVAAVVIVLIAWLLLRDGDSSSDSASAPVAAGKAQIVSAADLRSLEGEVGHPVYWAGEQAGAELELTNTAQGQIYVRYLTGGAEAGEPKPAFLTVGTYPVADAAGAIVHSAKQTGSKLAHAAGGAVVYIDHTNPTSVYLAYPGTDYQIEVYDPSPRRAIALALSGVIAPVG